MVGVSSGLDVSTPDYDGGECADELQEAKSVVGDEERETAGTVGAVSRRFFDHFCAGMNGDERVWIQ